MGFYTQIIFLEVREGFKNKKKQPKLGHCPNLWTPLHKVGIPYVIFIAVLDCTHYEMDFKNRKKIEQKIPL